MPKTVFASLVGIPNAGKSTLLNRLIGVKIAITSPKPQTTRNRIMGVYTHGDVQYVLIDTPGFHVPKTKLGEHMVNAVQESISGVDCALFVTYPKSEFSLEEKCLIEKLLAQKIPTILVLNKSDTLLSLSKGNACLHQLCCQYSFSAGTLVSALTGDHLTDLFDTLTRFAKDGPFHFPEDTLTDMPEKSIVGELIREKLLCHLRDELPHGCAVSVESFKERSNKPLIDIDAVILCERDSHKGMIIGKKGMMLKKIGSEARSDIENFLNCAVNLQLWIKVRSDWRNKENYVRDMGY